LFLHKWSMNKISIRELEIWGGNNLENTRFNNLHHIRPLNVSWGNSLWLLVWRVGEVDPTVTFFRFSPKKAATQTTILFVAYGHTTSILNPLCDLKPLFFWLHARIQKSILNRSVICEDKRIEVYDVTIFPYMQNR